MVDDLIRPSAYPDGPRSIKLVQTHISYVFIGDEFVYKIKKPVNFDFLDFSTLELRYKYCHKEVDLNSRFSKDVYLGVYPVTFDGTAHAIGGDGKIVDYAVKMRRLNEADLMKNRFLNGNITDDDIDRLAHTISGFHQNSERSSEIDRFGEVKAVRFNIDECFRQTQKFIGDTITRAQYDTLRAWTEKFYAHNRDLFVDRVRAGKIRDCHGDLHMEHICLTEPIILFDCIEFNDRFRYTDMISDLAFLLMDLEYHGGRKHAQMLLDAYLRYSNDRDIAELVRLYKVYRAYVRCKVNSFLLNDPAVSPDRKNDARMTARRYFQLAYSYINDKKNC